ncbi:Protein transport protein Sec61 subunit gamma [Glycine soja]
MTSLDPAWHDSIGQYTYISELNLHKHLMNEKKSNSDPNETQERQTEKRMDAIDSVFDPLREFAKDSVRLVKRCHKPDRKGCCAYRDRFRCDGIRGSSSFQLTTSSSDLVRMRGIAIASGIQVIKQNERQKEFQLQIDSSMKLIVVLLYFIFGLPLYLRKHYNFI